MIRTKIELLLLLAATNSQANQFPLTTQAREKPFADSILRGGSPYPEQPPFQDRSVLTGATSASAIQSMPPSPFCYDHCKEPYSTIVDETEDPFHETVQDRVDRWRQSQMEQLADRPSPDQSTRALTPEQQNRFRLIMSVSKGSRAFIFILLVLRSLHLFEVVDQTLSGKKILRLLAVVPIFILFVGNMAGVVASLTSPSHSAKKRLKAILNLDKLMEVVLIMFSFIRLTILPSRYTPREVYLANVVHSVLFIVQCQAFTRLLWDERFVPMAPPRAAAPKHSSQTKQQHIPVTRKERAAPFPPLQQQPYYDGPEAEDSIHYYNDEDGDPSWEEDNEYERRQAGLVPRQPSPYFQRDSQG